MNRIRRNFLYFLLFFSTIRIFLAKAIGNCNAFAPDEKSYLDILIYTDNPLVQINESTWASLPRLIRQVIFLPSLILHRIGLSYLMSFRVQMILMSALTISLLIFTIERILSTSSFSNSLNLSNVKWIRRYLILVSCLPTLLLWTTLGLREPFLYLGLAFVFLGMSLLTQSNSRFFPGAGVILIGEMLLAHTKFYIFLIVSLALILTFVNRFASEMKNAFMILSIVFLVTLTTGTAIQGLFDLRFTTSNFEFESQKNLNKKSVSISSEAIRQCLRNNEGGPVIQGIAKVFNLNPEPTNPEPTNPEPTMNRPSTDYVSSGPRNRINPFMILPGVINFLFFPTQVSEFGAIALIGVFESILWVPIYLLFIREVILKRKLKSRMNPVVSLALNFLLIFITFSAATEINFGTAIRHRSLVLLPIVLATLVLYSERNQNIRTESN